MSSPKTFTFFLFDEATGAPLTGATPTFLTYEDNTGTPVAQPAISEVGGGAYAFTPVFPVDLGLIFVIDGGSGSLPRRQGGFLRPEDYNVDLLTDINDATFGTWEIKISGPDANRLILYREDGVTVLKKFDLTDIGGSPSPVDTYKKTAI